MKTESRSDSDNRDFKDLSSLSKIPDDKSVIPLQGSFRDRSGFPDGASDKEATCQSRRHKKLGFHPWIWKIPWRRAQQSTPVFLPGESHGQRSLEGYSPWGHKESDTTEHLSAPAGTG